MHKKIKAFTLIELLVVIAIVGILSGFIFVSMNSAITASKDAKRKADLSAIAKAISMYSAQNGGALPSTGTSCDVCNGCLGACADLYTNISPYLTIIPTDPNGATVYYKYTYSETLPSFTLQSTLSSGYTYQFDSSTDGFSSIGYTSTCVSGGGLTCTEAIDGSYVVNKYTISGTTTGTTNWTVPYGVTSVQYLVVAGGGGGRQGGGGGGGLVAGNLSVSTGTLTVTVGKGGAAYTVGSNSIFGDIIAYGGGAGGSWQDTGKNGGSGGGAGAGQYPSYGGGVATPSGQGYNGGTTVTSHPNGFPSSGGGGAGGVGGNTSVGTGGNGGVGVSSLISGSSVCYAGGGGGTGGTTPGTASCGGGAGGKIDPPIAGIAGANNLGGGGGGGPDASNVAIGGSGVVIIRYTHP
jgi:prepilin-type N-terminal cleavage/methylation domain-containing protein